MNLCPKFCVKWAPRARIHCDSLPNNSK